jgi:hypothetical protein
LADLCDQRQITIPQRLISSRSWRARRRHFRRASTRSLSFGEAPPIIVYALIPAARAFYIACAFES